MADVRKQSKMFGETMRKREEIVVLLKYYSKLENILACTRELIEFDSEYEKRKTSDIAKLSHT